MIVVILSDSHLGSVSLWRNVTVDLKKHKRTAHLLGIKLRNPPTLYDQFNEPC